MGLCGVYGSGARGESGAIYLLTDSPTVSERYIADALTSRGFNTVIVNISETPLHRIPGVAFLRIKNPYAAVVYGSLAEHSINPPSGIIAALNRLSWLPKFGPPYAVVLSDFSVEKVEIERPWVLLTAWKLALDGSVTSVEGAKSVIEHRMYMRNPLAKVSVVIPKPHRLVSIFATIKHASGLAEDILSHLGLFYAKITLGDYGGKLYVVDIDPVPPLETKEEAALVAELI
ncbi:hypothetical protein Pisl_0275 [Pyrobaculum islandicum DSM 4184]|uniref:Uncharacterized protein n=1 Tax=Pyrobaculum islandicum (strain DSM 4184 / JCM 9189 / GEO3) TaxID=384616 RepID=A1RR72_PYRIL|nr:hypothetical protein Pisl_0275 [Pyrobaculum islandicum DSM 4184]